jgi:DNA polymerase (family 10)
VAQIEVAGSYRRRKDTVGDIDILVASSQPRTVMRRFAAYPRVKQVQAEGPTRGSIVLDCGLQVDLRVVPAASFGSALHYFTGSKPHNIAVRALALKQGLKVSEYGVFRRTRRMAGRAEADVFAAVGLPWIPPELREARGEIDAARAGRLPHLVELADIRGDLQMHTTASDGRNSIEEMAAAARALGYEYIALTDHSKAVTVANGLDEKRTREQIRKIHAANAKKPGIRILAGSEVDILKDGRLDLDDEVLAELDVVVASVHSYMNLERAEMTERLLAAIENPYTQILGHPTGRLLLRREGFPFDMEAILDAAARHGVAMECNASPERLDLKDTYLRMAKERGVCVVISTDAHVTTTLQFMRYGVQTARRGWLEKKDVLNTLPLERFLAALRAKPGAASARHARPAARRRAAAG